MNKVILSLLICASLQMYSMDDQSDTQNNIMADIDSQIKAINSSYTIFDGMRDAGLSLGVIGGATVLQSLKERQINPNTQFRTSSILLPIGYVLYKKTSKLERKFLCDNQSKIKNILATEAMNAGITKEKASDIIKDNSKNNDEWNDEGMIADLYTFIKQERTKKVN